MKTFLQFVSEGGAAGHMAHPYDLPQVNTGQDLIKFFQQAASALEKDPSIASVKIDGVNVSFKYVGGQFAIDRGSMKPIDVEGITIDRLRERFGEGHGMIESGTKLLTILNASIKDVRSELASLGLLDNPNRFLNCEYVEGKTNVTSYTQNFIAIHGVNQFEQVTPKRRASHEVPYDQKALQRLIDKLQPYAKKHGFVVYGSVPISHKQKSPIKFDYTLAQRITLKQGPKTITKTLKQWLSTAKNPRATMIKCLDGSTRGALSFFTYNALLQTQDANTLAQSAPDQKQAIDGFVLFHATRVLGNVVLRHFSTPMGDLTEQEGVVLRLPGSDRPVKITGDFMINKTLSSFGSK